MISTLYNRIADLYDLLDLPFELLFYRELREKTITGIHSSKVLEIGVGTGKNIPYYRPGNRVTAVDVSDEMLKKAKNRIREDLEVDFIKVKEGQLPFSDDQFDVVVATFVIYLQDKKENLVDEISRVLKAGGSLVIIEYKSPQSPFGMALANLISKITKPLYHLDFTDMNTRNLLLQYGMKEHSHSTNGWLFTSNFQNNR